MWLFGFGGGDVFPRCVAAFIPSRALNVPPSWPTHRAVACKTDMARLHIHVEPYLFLFVLLERFLCVSLACRAFLKLRYLGSRLSRRKV